MDNNYDEHFLFIRSKIDDNKLDTDEKQMKTDQKLTHLTEDLKVLIATITSMMYQNNNSKLSPSQKDISNPPYPTTVVPAYRRATPLGRGNSIKIGSMWTLKHDISSPKFYEILINTEIKGDIDLDLKNFYNHIKMCINVVTILREYLIPDYLTTHFLKERDRKSVVTS